MFALRMFPSQNVIKKPRSATSVTRIQTQTATPPPSARSPAGSHTPNASQVLESAHHAIQRTTKNAVNSRKSAEQNASHKRSHFAMKKLESAQNAKIHQTQVASQPLDAKRLASANQKMPNTNAHGRLLTQLVLKIRRVPRARPSAPNNAKRLNSPSVTSRTTPVLSVNMTRTQLASKPRTTAMLPRKKENARQKN